MRVALLAMMWFAASAVVVVPLVFRRQRWVRMVAVLAMLGIAEFAWMCVLTSPRLAIEKAGIGSWEPNDRFVQGALATRDIAAQMNGVFWFAVLGLAVLALVPYGAQPAPPRMPWRRAILLLSVAAVIIAGLFWSWRIWEQLKVKRTVTSVATLGRMCLAERPDSVDLASLSQLADKFGVSAKDRLMDAWGHELKVVKTSDDSGVHYTVFATGPGAWPSALKPTTGTIPSEAADAAFIWRDGTWLREYDPRRGGIVEH